MGGLIHRAGLTNARDLIDEILTRCKRPLLYLRPNPQERMRSVVNSLLRNLECGCGLLRRDEGRTADAGIRKGRHRQKLHDHHNRHQHGKEFLHTTNLLWK